ncbi:hypothetical protein ACF08N_22635 [Streptomyces sp. NPDC015127]|uniref:hypothetical protein n=1 Tax=Streptomyces sp. NPDC015127 TaxID=3364939 RepID=UPI00370366B4
MKIEVIACDIDQKVPAKTYTITASDGRSISKDLCEEHAEPFEEWLEEAVAEEPEPEPVPQPRREREKRQEPPAKRTVRRRPKVMTLEEIEAQKKG